MDNRTLPIAQAAAGDQEAFDLLVHRMMPLIHAQVHRFRCAGVEDDDLAQEALMGLLAAVRTYRDDCGAAFTTYATACIRHRLLSVARRYGSLVDATQTMVAKIDDDTYQVQVVSWYDNENSYTSQMVRTIKYFAELA